VGQSLRYKGSVSRDIVETTPYSVAEVAALTGLSASTVTKLFEHEPGVIAYQVPNPSAQAPPPDHSHSPARL